MIHNNRFTVPIKSKSNDSANTTVIILASIPNDRMKTMPSVSLMMVDKQNHVIDIQVEAIRTVFPKSDIVLVTGHDATQVIEHRPTCVRIVENQMYESRGENEELRLGLNNSTTDNTLIISGNCIFNSNALQHLKNHASCTLIDKRQQIDKDSLGVISNNGRVENIAYGVMDKWCYITYLEARETKILRKFASAKNKSNMCFFEAINYVTSHGGVINTVGQQNGYLRRITSSKDMIV